MKTTFTRREFAKLTMAAGAVATMGQLGCTPTPDSKSIQKRVAIQLYTIRELTKTDFAGNLSKIAKIGYDGVEFAGYGGLSAKEVKQLIEDLGLVAVGSHEGFEGMEANIEQRIEFNLEIGNQFMVVPSMPGKWRENGADGIKQFAEKMTEFGALIKKTGMQLCYHNHSFEFQVIDGKTILEHLFDATDPTLVQAELDVYWVQHGKADPVALVKRYAGRCPLLHMKDMAGGEVQVDVPVGTGILDMKGIIEVAKANDKPWFIVEQDNPQKPILWAVELSLKNMRRLLEK